MGDGGDLLSIDGQTGLGANSVSAIRNLGETAMTTREAALEAALKEARGTILHLINMRYSEAEGSDEDWVGDIDNALAARPAPQPEAEPLTRVSLADLEGYGSTTQPAADTRVDLINRMDAVQACQVGPSDEWAKATKDGYNQAATDCAFNILKIKPAIIVNATPAPSDNIAEAARVDQRTVGEIEFVLLKAGYIYPAKVLRDLFTEREAAIRALAGKGE